MITCALLFWDGKAVERASGIKGKTTLFGKTSLVALLDSLLAVVMALASLLLREQSLNARSLLAG
eukprot:scaffold25746_cov22-Tisochrysis_lutea.AAC.1